MPRGLSLLLAPLAALTFALLPVSASAQSEPTTPLELSLPGITRFDLDRTEIAAFVDHMVTLGMTREAVDAVLAKAEPQPKIIDAMTKPAEKSLAWWEYRARFLDDHASELAVDLNIGFPVKRAKYRARVRDMA